MDVFGAILWVRDRKWIGYAIAVIGPALAVMGRSALGVHLSSYPFITFFPPILLAAFFGGRIPGAIAMVLTAVAVDYFIVEPYEFRLAWPGVIALSLFLPVSGVVIWLVDFALRASARLVLASRELRVINDGLEERVAERTRELTQMAKQLREEIRTKEIAEAQVRHMQKTQALGQLTSGIAHDFNNMLSVVIGSLDIASRRLDEGHTDIAGFIDNAMDGARRSTTLTHQLLAFSRQQPLAPVLIDVNALISHLGELLRRALGETIYLECVIGGGLWRTFIDPSQLESAILNLAVNARDAMPDGGKLTIETQNAFLDNLYTEANPDVAPGQYVLIAISDTGTGMTEEVAARAFDPFFTTKAEGRGTGLGLSQVYGFIKQSGGHIKIYSEVGHGTSIKIYLPRHAADAALHAFSESQAAATPVGSAREIILVVDDNDAVRDIHVDMLRELNYTVRHAASGPEALAMIAAQPDISLLSTDVVMPEMSGRVLAERAKALIHNLKVLYTTGYTANAVVHNGVIDHGVDLLQKPFTYDQLARKVRSILDRR